MKGHRWKYPACLLACALMTGLFATGVLFNVDATLSDALYQHPAALDGQVVVIGIDQRAMEDLGPYATWGRDVMAQAVEALNADPEHRPAAIGLDVIYAGETDPETDAWLAQAAGAWGNVVVACNAEFGARPVTNADGSFSIDNYALLSFNQPYPALAGVAHLGHVNAMYDTDGVLRHAIWQVDLPDGRSIPSFHQQIYRLYAAEHGLDPDVTPPLGARHFWYLPFQGEAGAFYDGLSVADLLSGDFDPAELQGKVVLIGPYEAALQDSYPTAVDHAAHMFGVEYQANAVTALIRQDFKAELPLPPQLLAVFLLSLLWLLWLWDRPVLPATAAWLLSLAAAAGVCWGAYQLSWVLRVLYLPLSMTAFFVASVAANYVRAAVAKRQITTTFQRYVAPEIVSELLREDSDALALGGRLADIAVLFVDIRGFTPMSEALEPTQVVEILNRYLTLTTQCVFQNGGTLDKFVGDCTMAFWGAPLPQEDCVYKAVKAALDMVEGSQALSRALLEHYGRTVRFGVGIHWGPAVVGNIGAPTRMDYTAIGDTVNTASRLESVAAGGQILVSRAVADALEGRVRFTSLGDGILLKGKAAGFEVLAVDGLL